MTSNVGDVDHVHGGEGRHNRKRPPRTSAERRAQHVRSEARAIQAVVRKIRLLGQHRGSRPSFGGLQVIRELEAPDLAAVPLPCFGRGQEALPEDVVKDVSSDA